MWDYRCESQHLALVLQQPHSSLSHIKYIFFLLFLSFNQISAFCGALQNHTFKRFQEWSYCEPIKPLRCTGFFCIINTDKMLPQKESSTHLSSHNSNFCNDDVKCMGWLIWDSQQITELLFEGLEWPIITTANLSRLLLPTSLSRCLLFLSSL